MSINARGSTFIPSSTSPSSATDQSILSTAAWRIVVHFFLSRRMVVAVYARVFAPHTASVYPVYRLVLRFLVPVVSSKISLASSPIWPVLIKSSPRSSYIPQRNEVRSIFLKKNKCQRTTAMAIARPPTG
jgi:hypothetical protein